MLRLIQTSWRHRSSYLSLAIVCAIVASMVAPMVYAQAPLAGPTPDPTVIIPAPQSAPSHPAVPSLPPPAPAGVPAILPPISAAPAAPLATSKDPLDPASIRETAQHLERRCDFDDCGGADPPPGSGLDPNFSSTRARPQNETGQPGVDLGSRNFNWNLPLVELKGRSGLDLNLALHYNSLVWTRQGTAIRFNSDRGFPGPASGFTLGLPKLQQRYQSQNGWLYAYMLVTPSGGRVELHQVGSSAIYESRDGSYMQLIDSNTTKVLRTKDGTQYTFLPQADGEFRCTEIKDRNGNYITATYNQNSDISTITDTLGRIIQFNYDAANYLISITQTWTVNGQPVVHEWATFNYSPTLVQPNFPGLIVQGPDNMTIPALTAVTLADGSSYNFEYTTWGQVFQITQKAADGHARSRTTYNLPLDSSSPQSDCPRFTERRDWAEYWTETVTRYSVHTGGAWTQVTHPDGTVYKEVFSNSSWLWGLTVGTELYSPDNLSSPKKWTTIEWTRDPDGGAYQPGNPRPVETNTYDSAGNHRRITIDYSSFSLPSAVREWTGAGGDTLYRLTVTGYRFDDEYINRRIIGLVDNVQVTDGGGALLSKTSYGYDFYSDYFQDTPAPAVQHDRANYGPSVIFGRGNLSQIARWDVTAPHNANKISETKRRFNSTGAVLMVRDPSLHETQISYNDSFEDGVSRNTFAFPTTVTDADGYSSTAQYDYDFGAITRTQDPKGAITTFSYDPIGRPERVTSAFDGAYTRWVYPLSQNYVDVFSTIAFGESFTRQVFDGAGRIYRNVVTLLYSTGGYAAQSFQYDSMGRLQYQSNPAEVNGVWVPVGDDAGGWTWTEQRYDYLGRPTLTINPDGKSREAVYGGCGCAGGEVVTVRDETGRRRRITADALGRQSRVEELNWDQTVYSTTNYSYNARDQITSITQQNDRARTFEYDGHGRLAQRTTPEQGSTTFSYYQDDAVQTVTDTRGASQTLMYNGRHLPTSINYHVPSGVEPTPNVSFNYDEAGNRTLMMDGFGRVDYVYNTLSQMTSESRTFSGVGSYNLSYEYNLGGQLARITNPWNVQVSYNYDSMGRPTRMLGANFAGVSSYVNNITYRAFGVKGITYSNGRGLTTAYDSRMRLTTWNVSGVTGYNYSYNTANLNESTSRVSYAQNLYDSTLDRSYQYDHVGRLVVSHSGAEARAHALTGGAPTPDGPFSHGYDYDVWGNITSRSGWGGWNPSYSNASFNNKNQMTTNPTNGNAMQYDAAGNMIHDGWQTFTYDATGAQVQAPMQPKWQGHDGDDLRVKDVQGGYAKYYLRSTVLGGRVVAEINSSGQWLRGYVYQGERLVALQQFGEVNWVHQDPVNKTQRITNSAGQVVAGIELDPWGAETNRSWNDHRQSHRFTTWERDWTGDESLFRRYHGWWSRFAHPDPYDGSYDLTDPQSFNRYAYVQNDPVNFVDPSGLLPCVEGEYGAGCGGGGTWTVNVYVSWSDRIIDGYGADRGLNNGSSGTIPMRPLIEPRVPPEPEPEPQDKPQLERNLSHDTQNYDRWHRHFAACAREKGFQVAVDGALFMAGQPLRSKRFTTPGASQGTSFLSRALGRGPTLSRGVWAPTLNRLGSTTAHLGRAVSRWIPWGAVAHLGVHFAEIVSCANERYDKGQ